MSHTRLIGTAILGTLGLLTFGSRVATAADEIVITSVRWQSTVQMGQIWYYVEASGTFKSAMMPSIVRLSRPVGGPPPQDQTLRNTSLTYDPIAKTGTWTTTGYTLLFANPPALMTVDARLDVGGCVTAATYQNIPFPNP